MKTQTFAVVFFVKLPFQYMSLVLRSQSSSLANNLTVSMSGITKKCD